ncbi:hypothetical protein HU200_050354 [Digitaria exilis]|uniref:F-box domain-containing protein n=1 Tax=Digitaria exilis TaxID=1010633 RepID=A0A835E7W1_9POAL|nr:hypothetical protein HU200_050354 [Digitaria exilis]CAB3473286.1 unnamed protein product [Digitaria exilis]
MGKTGASKPRLPTNILACLSEDNIADILLRLPAKSVLRCRLVCKAWRSITTDPNFLSQHARLRPADVVLYTYQYLDTPYYTDWDDEPHFTDIGLDVVPVSSDEAAGRRHIMRYPKMRDWFLLASSDGVLLFKKHEEVFVLCNPTTRLWAELPRLPRADKNSRSLSDREYAFYLDTASGEYKLLCRGNLTTTGTWCILSTGASEPRQLDMHAAEAAGITELVPSLRKAAAIHVNLHGRLHWPPHQGSVTGQTEMVVFDMSLETLHLMAAPPRTTDKMTKLFDMDGMLVAADFGKPKHIDLWYLEDYDARRWQLRHRVATPCELGYAMPHIVPRTLVSVAAAGDREGNIMLGNGGGLVVYNTTNKTVKNIESVATSRNSVVVSRHVFKESLVQGPGFVAAAQFSVDLSLVHF